MGLYEDMVELEELRQDRDRERDRGNGIRRGPEPRIRVLASRRGLGMQSSAELDCWIAATRR